MNQPKFSVNQFIEHKNTPDVFHGYISFILFNGSWSYRVKDGEETFDLDEQTVEKFYHVYDKVVEKGSPRV